MEKFKDNVKQLGRDTEWFKLTKIDEEITVNTYRSKTDAKLAVKQPRDDIYDVSGIAKHKDYDRNVLGTANSTGDEFATVQKGDFIGEGESDLQRLFGLNNVRLWQLKRQRFN